MMMERMLEMLMAMMQGGNQMGGNPYGPPMGGQTRCQGGAPGGMAWPGECGQLRATMAPIWGETMARAEATRSTRPVSATRGCQLVERRPGTRWNSPIPGGNEHRYRWVWFLPRRPLSSEPDQHAFVQWFFAQRRQHALPRLASSTGQEIRRQAGDLALVKNGDKMSPAIFGDVGPRNKLGEGSTRLAQNLGINSDPNRGGKEGGVQYMVFPGSGRGVQWNSQNTTTDALWSRVNALTGGGVGFLGRQGKEASEASAYQGLSPGCIPGPWPGDRREGQSFWRQSFRRVEFCSTQ